MVLRCEEQHRLAARTRNRRTTEIDRNRPMTAKIASFSLVSFSRQPERSMSSFGRIRIIRRLIRRTFDRNRWKPALVLLRRSRELAARTSVSKEDDAKKIRIESSSNYRKIYDLVYTDRRKDDGVSDFIARTSTLDLRALVKFKFRFESERARLARPGDAAIEHVGHVVRFNRDGT